MPYPEQGQDQSTGVTTSRDNPNLQKVKDNGQQEAYLVLSPEERAKGFVRPLRTAYKHLPCGTETRMGLAIAETYARDPKFYGGTFCVACRTHFPLGQFVWLDGTPVGS